jgi:DNA-binding response OmpR family regulator
MDRAHILVIEDDTSVCELLLTGLNREGYRVSVAQSGETALLQIEEDPPQLLILDLNLPGMSGLDLCRNVRRDPWMGNLPIIMLTGQTEEDDMVIGLEVGADDYMTKPFTLKVLSARVKALLRRGTKPAARQGRRGVASEEPPKAGLIVKTLGKSELEFDGVRMSWAENFSPAQRQLMSMLVSAPQCKVSQEEVQVALWPESAPQRARSSFDSLLSRVRQTLGSELPGFDSKKALIVKHGYLCLENARVDAHEFVRLVHKASQQLGVGEAWPAEITFSSAFSLWQGRYVPGDFGSEAAIIFQDELEQVYITASMTFARLLAANGRLKPAAKLLHDAQRYHPTNDELARLLYRLCLAQDNPGQAGKVLKLYREALARDNFSAAEIDEIESSFHELRPQIDRLATTKD